MLLLTIDIKTPYTETLYLADLLQQERDDSEDPC